MSVVSEKYLYRFYTSKRKGKQRKPCPVSRYIFECKIKLPSFCTCFFLESSFTLSLTFDIGHIGQFSKQSPRLMGNLLCLTPTRQKEILYRMFSWKPFGNWYFGRPRRKWNNTRGAGCEGKKWMGREWDKSQWTVLVTLALNLPVMLPEVWVWLAQMYEDIHISIKGEMQDW
jgi:hypothetical protein